MIRFYLLLLPVLLCTTAVADAQDMEGFGGGEYDVSAMDAPMSEDVDQAMREEAERNVRALEASGQLEFDPEAVVEFTWPLAAPSLPDSGYHGVSAFFDKDPRSGLVLDYNCGDRTYGGHGGTDFFTWPFPWYKMDHDQVEIVAAAPGTITAKFDGNFDRSCSATGGQWNAVNVTHDDGSEVRYGHMKNGSPTEKPVGATVERGEYLGVLGSSGNSTGPHLHFQVHDPVDGSVFDPFEGNCNSDVESSWWQDQIPYYDSAVNVVMTGFATPEFPPCPQQEILNAADEFEAGEVVYFSTFYRDQLAGQESLYSIFRPDGSLFESWTHSITASHYSASWWWWSRTLPEDAPGGEWTFQVDYEGEAYVHTFTVNGTIDTEERPGTPASYRVSAVFPNPSDAAARFTIEVETPQHIQVAVYDVIGRAVATIHEGTLAPGQSHEMTFDTRGLRSGVYLLRVDGETFSEARRVSIVR